MIGKCIIDAKFGGYSYERESTMIDYLSKVLMLIILTICPVIADGQNTRNLAREKSAGDLSERRVALVIGNSAYSKAKNLRNPANDARDMATSLKEVGFDVLFGVDLDKRQMMDLIRDFGTKLASGGVGLFYYAGHGIQVDGENYLIPVEAEIPQEDEISYAAVPVGLILAKMAAAKNDLNIIILDACRNNPFARSWRGVRDLETNNGLAKISPPTGTLVLYATEPGKTASDGEGRNGLFTEALLRHIKRPDVEYDQMVKGLSADVWKESNKKQLPWKEGNTLADFYFVRTADVLHTTPVPATLTSKDRENSGSIKPGTIRKNSIGMELVWIPPGEFMMGSTEEDINVVFFQALLSNDAAKRQWYEKETPRHKVTIREGFWMGKYEVTQEQWVAVMGANPSSFASGGDNCPVERVSWDDIQVFLTKLNIKNDGLEYRLPSEAQWEYAARAGTTTTYAFGDTLDSSQANFNSGGNPYNNRTKLVGSYKPNGWGLYDMHGNVFEWCEDILSVNYLQLPTDGSANRSVGDSNNRVVRGGAWDYIPGNLNCRSSYRGGLPSSGRYTNCGFRIAARLKDGR